MSLRRRSFLTLLTSVFITPNSTTKTIECNGNVGLGTATPTGKLIIESNGNVGLGTTTPTTILIIKNQ